MRNTGVIVRTATPYSERLGTDDAHRHALDGEAGLRGIDHDGRKRSVLGHERDFTPATFQSFDGDFLAQARDDDLAASRVVGLVHDEEVAVEDACILHARAFDAQQVIGARREERRIDAVLRFDVLGGEDGRSGRDASHEGQGPLNRHAGHVAQAQAARGAGRQFDGALARERLQVIFRRARGGEAEAAAISARVGGMPVASMCPRIQSRICCCRAVRRGISMLPRTAG
jgi:hypothetical protein